MKMVAKKARELKVDIGPDFARKPKVIIPDLVETASAAGTFQV